MLACDQSESLWVSEQQTEKVRRSRMLGYMVDRGSIIVGSGTGKGRSALMLSAQELLTRTIQR